MQKPTKKGQKFVHLGEIFTVKCFIGKSEVVFDTIEEAKKENFDTEIFITNKEYDGVSEYSKTYLIPKYKAYLLALIPKSLVRYFL